MKYYIGFFGSHNSAIAIGTDKQVLEIVELERWVNVKNAAFAYHFPIPNREIVLSDIIEYLMNKYSIKIFEVCAHNSSDGLEHLIPAKEYKHVQHHQAHAYNGLFQSGYLQANVISFDGGSEHGFFHIYQFDLEKSSLPHLLFSPPSDLCVPYATVAHYLEPIKKENNIWIGNLTYAGKLMGLSGYGKVRDEYIYKLEKFFREQTVDRVDISHENFCKIFECKTFKGNDAYDMATSTQYVFEKLFEEYTREYRNNNLIFVGGGAMNILNNAKYDCFVPPNPDDRGVALGCLLSITQTPTNSMYLGMDIDGNIPYYNTITEIVDFLSNDEVVGLLQGRQECGARALGNRSILTLPGYGKKELLNSKVKFREYFRPFSPMTRDVDVDKYFDNHYPNHWMSHNSKVKYQSKRLSSITHVDDSARVQVVTQKLNPNIYSILTELENRNILPILLNTSFNIQGQPIINKVSDGLTMYHNRQIDRLCFLR